MSTRRLSWLIALGLLVGSAAPAHAVYPGRMPPWRPIPPRPIDPPVLPDGPYKPPVLPRPGGPPSLLDDPFAPPGGRFPPIDSGLGGSAALTLEQGRKLSRGIGDQTRRFSQRFPRGKTLANQAAFNQEAAALRSSLASRKLTGPEVVGLHGALQQIVRQRPASAGPLSNDNEVQAIQFVVWTNVLSRPPPPEEVPIIPLLQIRPDKGMAFGLRVERPVSEVAKPLRSTLDPDALIYVQRHPSLDQLDTLPSIRSAMDLPAIPGGRLQILEIDSTTLANVGAEHLYFKGQGADEEFRLARPGGQQKVILDSVAIAGLACATAELLGDSCEIYLIVVEPNAPASSDNR